MPYESPGGEDMRRALAEVQRRRRERLEDPEVQRELAEARREAAEAARILRERFGATRVRLFGSLARMDPGERFDIDLAVEGIAPELFFKASAAADMVVTRSLDVIDAADAPPLLRQRIEEEGVDLP